MTLNRQFSSVEESLSTFASDDLLFEPDTDFHYSTLGYTLLSSVIEGATGKTFLENLRNEITEPLGLTRTEADDTRVPHPHRTTDYLASPEHGVVLASPAANSSNKWAGGGLLSTPAELARFGDALLAAWVVTAAAAQEMFTARKLRNGAVNPQQYGLGWRIGTMKVGSTTARIVHHGGTAIGSQCALLLAPEHRISVAVCGNAYQGGSDTVLRAAADIARAFIDPA